MWVTILQVIASLSILVTLHECGHFFPARWFNTKVEKFYLFFDPWFSLFKVQKGDTEYGIGWLPLGGYVKIAGMIDESFDKEQMAGPAQPWEFRSKPAWQRLIIMLGGVTVNFILGVVIFSLMFWHWGDSYIDNSSLPAGVYVDSIAMEIGLRDGDQIKYLGDQPFDKFNGRLISKAIIIDNIKDITVVRDGSEMKIPVDPKFVGELSAYGNNKAELVQPRVPGFVEVVDKDSPAEGAGMIAGDRIIGLNGKNTTYLQEFRESLAEQSSDDINVTVLRDGRDTINMPMTLKDGRMGIMWRPLDKILTFKDQKYSLAECWGPGWKRSTGFLSDQISAFGQMFSGKIKAKDSLGSFISIGKMFGDEWDWRRFWGMTAMLSLLLGFLNLMPIPALDGGHVMFLLWEVITGRKPNEKVMEYATMIGFFLLIVLMIYAIGLDISRLF